MTPAPMFDRAPTSASPSRREIDALRAERKTLLLRRVKFGSASLKVVDEMCARGAVPYAALGVYHTQGRAYNEAMAGFFEARGY